MTADGGAQRPVYRPSLLYRVLLRFAVPLVLATWVHVEVEGRQHIPRSGPLIVVSNHVDNNDSYVIGRFIPSTVHYLARPAGMRSPVLGRFWKAMAAIPADREGLQQALALLRAGEVLGVYPDGVITPQLRQAKAGVAVLAVRSGAPVLPVAVWGTERVRIWPLPRGRRVRVHVRFGPPRLLERRAVRGAGLQHLADLLMTDVAALLPPEYRGYYAAAVRDEAARQECLEPPAGVNGVQPAPDRGAASGAAGYDSEEEKAL